MTKNLNDINKFEVMFDNIIIQPVKENEVVNGLILPTSYEEKTMIGKILKVGHGRLMDNGIIIPLLEKPGDFVLFNKYSTTQLFIKGVEYLVLRSEDVVAIYRD